MLVMFNAVGLTGSDYSTGSEKGIVDQDFKM